MPYVLQGDLFRRQSGDSTEQGTLLQPKAYSALSNPFTHAAPLKNSPLGHHYITTFTTLKPGTPKFPLLRNDPPKNKHVSPLPLSNTFLQHHRLRRRRRRPTNRARLRTRRRLPIPEQRLQRRDLRHADAADPRRVPQRALHGHRQRIHHIAAQLQRQRHAAADRDGPRRLRELDDWRGRRQRRAGQVPVVRRPGGYREHGLRVLWGWRRARVVVRRGGGDEFRCGAAQCRGDECAGGSESY